jgi:hypothetical protein
VAIGMTGAVDGTVHAIGRVVPVDTVGSSDAALDTLQRGCWAGGFAGRRQQVVIDVLDEDSLSLLAR